MRFVLFLRVILLPDLLQGCEGKETSLCLPHSGRRLDLLTPFENNQIIDLALIKGANDSQRILYQVTLYNLGIGVSTL